MNGVSANLRLNRGSFRLDLAIALPDSGLTAVLGASGGGKTTLLRLLAGLEKPDAGTITVDGVPWVDRQKGIFLPPQRRGVGMVFQDYALFNHMTVAENVGYGLPRAQRKAEVPDLLDQFHLTEFADRRPDTLSGGQRQRVALARALARDPSLLLLDEPFSAIDVALRATLRAQVAGTIAGLRRPVLLVTHDPMEARALADRILVIGEGQLLASGDIREVMDDPRERSVAAILGWRNLLPVTQPQGKSVAGPWGHVDLNREASFDTAYLGIQPERIRLLPEGADGLPARVVRLVDLGAVWELQCRLQDGTLVTVNRVWDDPVPAPGTALTLGFPPQHVRLMGEGVALPATAVPPALALAS
ncbi:MAG: ABC transporter ATP-binding protein [Magnetospiraceae bacterium]